MTTKSLQYSGRIALAMLRRPLASLPQPQLPRHAIRPLYYADKLAINRYGAIDSYTCGSSFRFFRSLAGHSSLSLNCLSEASSSVNTASLVTSIEVDALGTSDTLSAADLVSTSLPDELLRPLPVHIYVDAGVRAHLAMPNADRKAKVFLAKTVLSLPALSEANNALISERHEGEMAGGTLVSPPPPPTTTIADGEIYLRTLVERRFPALLGQPYTLRYRLPSPDGQSKLPNLDNSVGDRTRGVSRAIPVLPADTPMAGEGVISRNGRPRGDRDGSAADKRRFRSQDRTSQTTATDAMGVDLSTPAHTAQGLTAIQAVREALARKLPSLMLYVDPTPTSGFPPSSENQPWLRGMPDPLDSTEMSLLSFYRFRKIAHPEETAEALKALWAPFHAVGRVYVASEGVNAQCAVPSSVVDRFRAACDSHWLFEENSPDSPPYPFFLNVDHNMTLEAFRSAKPFAALHIRVRKQIVADGLEDRGLTGSAALDWNKSGKEMDAISWHQALDDEPSAVVLDCRNAYESEVGRFDRAIPLNTTAFRDSWDAIDRALDGVDKDTPVMTYCTGGIRCIKTNAYIEQRLGFTNVNRLQGGIISYARELEAAKEVERNDEAAAAAAAVAVGMEGIEQLHAQLQRGDQVEQKGVPSTPSPHLTRDLSGRNFAGGSKFRGVNYVFDERMGARITADVLSACSTCGAPCDAFLNCNNVMCNLRFLQCPACRSAYSACCSKACETAARDWTTQEANNRMVPRSKRANANANATPNNPTGAGKGAGKGTGEGTGEGPVRRSLVLEPDFIDGTDVTGSSALPSSAEQRGTFEQQPQQPSALLDHAHAIDAHLNALNGYAERYSAAEPSLLTELREATEGTFGEAARMVSGPLQGRLLAMLARTTGARRILELGAFTGYATLCLAEGLVRGDSAVSAGASVEVEARAGNGEGGASITTPRVDTCEPDERAADVAESFFARSRHGDKISLHRCSADDLLTRIRTEQGTAVGGLLHIAFIDADKKAYLRYVQELVGGSMSLLPVPSEQDVRDARGTEWLSQIDKQPLLAEGALVIVDNTLWKGLVLTQEADLSAWAPPPSAFGAAKRMLTLANTMHDFNAAVKGSGPAINHREERENSTSDLAAVRPGRLEPVLLPVRDGLTLLRFSQEPIESH